MCYFRTQGLVLFVMKDSKVTFKGKTSPGGRGVKGRGGGIEEKNAKGRRNIKKEQKEHGLGAFLPSPSPLFRLLPLRSRKRSCSKIGGIRVRIIRMFPFSTDSIRLRLRR